MAYVIRRRTQVCTASGLGFLAAVWLLVSPWVLHYTSTEYASVNNVCFAVVIGLLALVQTFGVYQAPSLSWINALLGVWVLISPWVLGFANHPRELWNNVGSGALITLLAVWSALASATASPDDMVDRVEREYNERNQFHGPAA